MVEKRCWKLPEYSSKSISMTNQNKAKAFIILTCCNTLFQWPIKTRQKNLSFWLDVILNPIQILFTGSNLNQTYVSRLQDLNTPSLCIYPSPWQPLGQRRLIELVLDRVLERKKLKNKSMTSTCSCKVKRKVKIWQL